HHDSLPPISASAFLDSAGDAAVARMPIAVYFCPTRRSPQTLGGPGGFGERAAIDYAGNGGPWFGDPDSHPPVLIPSPIADRDGNAIQWVVNLKTSGTIIKSRKHFSSAQTFAVDQPLR